LVDPSSWDDRNDSYYIEQYAKLKNYKSTYALCLAEAPETYHHWKVFSHGNGGACIEFDKSIFLEAVNKVNGLRAEEVKYKTIEALRKSSPDDSDLPFLKRYAFIDEKEFRLFYASNNEGSPIFRVEAPLKAIRRITLSPWLSSSVVTHVKSTLKSIEGCESLKIYKSTLVENENWKKFASKCA